MHSREFEVRGCAEPRSGAGMHAELGTIIARASGALHFVPICGTPWLAGRRTVNGSLHYNYTPLCSGPCGAGFCTGRALTRAAGAAVRRSACCSGSRGCGRSTRTSTGATLPTAAPRATCTASWSGARTCRTACCTRRARRITPCSSARPAQPLPAPALFRVQMRAGAPLSPRFSSTSYSGVRPCQPSLLHYSVLKCARRPYPAPARAARPAVASPLAIQHELP